MAPGGEFTARAVILPDLVRNITAAVGDHNHLIWDEYAIEVETGEFLYGLIRAAKPQLVVEAGTGRAFATRYMVEALLHNGSGSIITYEVNPELYEGARDGFAGFPVPITVRQGVPSDDGDTLKPDLVFIDCVSDRRVNEITYWLTRKDNPLVVVHDAKRPYPFDLGEGVHIPGWDGLWIGRPRKEP